MPKLKTNFMMDGFSLHTKNKLPLELWKKTIPSFDKFRFFHIIQVFNFLIFIKQINKYKTNTNNISFFIYFSDFFDRFYSNIEIKIYSNHLVKASIPVMALPKIRA